MERRILWVSPTGAWVLSVRLLALCHLAFFASFLYDGQHLALLGSRGILPLCETLDTVRSSALYQPGEKEKGVDSETVLADWDTAWWVRAMTPRPPLAAFHRFPTIFWLSCQDSVLQAVTYMGAGLSFFLFIFAGDSAVVHPLLLGGLLGFLAVLVLSFVAVGDPFMDAPWDHLLIEFSLLMALCAPVVLQSVQKGRFRRGERGEERGNLWLLLLARVSVALFIFRVMFGMGLQKFLNMREGSEWRAGTYIHRYFSWQPMPTPLAWYLHNADVGTEYKPVSQVLGGLTFVAEMLFPCFVFFNGVLRGLAVLVFAALMVGISLTGNFGVFQLLTIAASLPLLDGPLFGFSPPAKPTPSASLEMKRRPSRPTRALKESEEVSLSLSQETPVNDAHEIKQDKIGIEEDTKKSNACHRFIQNLCTLLTAVSLFALGAMGLAHLFHFFISHPGTGSRFTFISNNSYLFRGVRGEDEAAGRRIGKLMNSNPFPGPVLSALRFAAPLHLSHKVGIFREAALTRFVPVVEGSMSPQGPWRRYLWRHQMNILQRPHSGDAKGSASGRMPGVPSFLAPYQPRFDHQMFYEGGGISLDRVACLQLRNVRNPTRPYLVRWLMDNLPEVAKLVAENPFHGKGPVKFVRWGYVRARFSTRHELEERRKHEEEKSAKGKKRDGEEEVAGETAALLSPWWTPEETDERVDLIRWTLYSREKVEAMIEQGIEAFREDTARKRFPCMNVMI
uniref:Lipase maturation factor 1/2 N-terminal domain-containing protein n=1 Tax=Chromera velia CCMP2878 TaxID=1169474 RepID=A0A0G4HZ18_9ALVE|eukprot:Cvel_1563.t1-p1 / transcript=Cvel_1563.t1 / gene=Cvel_1563 / organism=Chromera_velia_CCMP2878 / gene_product=Lipase maturation factor 1, putative / transcript_product=Lipase maturation factor 1, putative / location=Cvel_scaffold55:132676-135972(-) / protein_length=732 / sequence_SO=supercontig / SO=protein_coding / is_pseudo=false